MMIIIIIIIISNGYMGRTGWHFNLPRENGRSRPPVSEGGNFGIYQSLHPQADVDRLDMSRKKGGRGLISVEDSISIEISSLKTYVSSREEVLLRTVRSVGVLKEPNGV